MKKRDGGCNDVRVVVVAVFSVGYVILQICSSVRDTCALQRKTRIKKSLHTGNVYV